MLAEMNARVGERCERCGRHLETAHSVAAGVDLVGAQ